MKFKDQEFSNQEIQMDFNQFINCKFIDCDIIYRGYGPIGLEGCSFTKVRWTFSDASANNLLSRHLQTSKLDVH